MNEFPEYQSKHRSRNKKCKKIKKQKLSIPKIRKRPHDNKEASDTANLAKKHHKTEVNIMPKRDKELNNDINVNPDTFLDNTLVTKVYPSTGSPYNNIECIRHIKQHIQTYKHIESYEINIKRDEHTLSDIDFEVQ